MKVISKKSLQSLDNMALIMRAYDSGLKIFKEDLLINYSEIDLTLSQTEDQWSDEAAAIMTNRFMKWLETVEKKEDLDPDKVDLELQPLLMEFIQSIWGYGQKTADETVQEIEIASYAEKTGGKPDISDLTNTDAFEWYQVYTKELARQGSDAAFTYMQPLILEKLEQGKVRLELATDLEDDFRRFGQVRTRIIARTESNKAFNWGRRYRFDKSAAIAGYRYSAILDERTTDICTNLHGHSWEIGDPGLNENTPPNHYQCRSVLVPISKYVTWEFDPPSAGWEALLPDKERKVYEKFKDSTFYPKAETVITKVAPRMEKPKKKAAPRKKKPEKKAISRKDLSHLELTTEDQEAIKQFDTYIKGVDFSWNRRKISKELLKRAGIDHMKVSIRKLRGAYGQVLYYDQGSKMDAKDFELLSEDYRSEAHQMRTLFHEFFHANYHGLSHDYKLDKWSASPDKLTRDEWLIWEETATELSAHFMMQRAGLQTGTVPSYSKYLTTVLPVLKQMDGFKDCETIEDFGAKFMKYRFSGSKSAEWKSFHDEYKELSKDFDHREYWEQYREEVMDNLTEITESVLAGYSVKNKDKHRNHYIKYIQEGIKSGWKIMKSTKGDTLWDSIIAAMVRGGVK
jgi:SPP1 gp7 family putative phage head morphogenesis protein